MTAVTIKVGGRDYRVACDDGQEEQLRFLADEVDDRVRSLLFGMDSNPGESLALLLTALTMADELAELRKENERLRQSSRQNGHAIDEERLRDVEAAMAATLDEIAGRIEKIAEQAEMPR